MGEGLACWVVRCVKEYIIIIFLEPFEIPQTDPRHLSRYPHTYLTHDDVFYHGGKGIKTFIGDETLRDVGQGAQWEML